MNPGGGTDAGGNPDAAAYLRFLRDLGFTHLPASVPTAHLPAPAEPETRRPAKARKIKPPSQPPAPAPPPAAGKTDAKSFVPPPEASGAASEPKSEPVAPAPETPDLFGAAESAAPQTPPLPLRERVATLGAREEELTNCDRCKLCPARNSAANRLVYGVGSPGAGVVFVGEGPGEQEDIEGEPFVGRAGELLTKIIRAMGLERSDVYICNVVKHRAPGNRDPERDEIEACEPFLIEQLDIIRPKVLVTLGNCATKTLLRTRTGITKLRGTWHSYHGIPTMPTYHTAFLLRSYTEKNRRDVWADMQAVLAKLGPGGAGKS